MRLLHGFLNYNARPTYCARDRAVKLRAIWRNPKRSSNFSLKTSFISAWTVSLSAKSISMFETGSDRLVFCPAPSAADSFRASRTPFRAHAKSVRNPSGMVFAIIPESRSDLSRIPVRLPPESPAPRSRRQKHYPHERRGELIFSKFLGFYSAVHAIRGLHFGGRIGLLRSS
jgi:hypothetical protein